MPWHANFPCQNGPGKLLGIPSYDPRKNSSWDSWVMLNDICWFQKSKMARKETQMKIITYYGFAIWHLRLLVWNKAKWLAVPVSCSVLRRSTTVRPPAKILKLATTLFVNTRPCDQKAANKTAKEELNSVPEVVRHLVGRLISIHLKDIEKYRIDI